VVPESIKKKKRKEKEKTGKIKKNIKFFRLKTWKGNLGKRKKTKYRLNK